MHSHRLGKIIRQQPIYRVMVASYLVVVFVPLFINSIWTWNAFGLVGAQLVWVIAGTFLSMLLALLITRWIAIPLDSLAHEAESILTTGNISNISRNSIIRTKYAPLEVQQLRIAFNKLVLGLKNSHDHLLSLLSNAPIIFLVIEPNGLIKFGAGKALRKLQIQPNQIVGQYIQKLWGEHINDRIFKKAVAGEATLTGITISGMELDVWVGPHYDDNKVVDSIFIVATDVTDTQKAKEYSQLVQDHKRLNREFVRVQEMERKSLANYLHDDIGQYIIAIKTAVARIERYNASEIDKIRSTAGDIDKMAGAISVSVTKNISRLRPSLLDDCGLVEAIESLRRNWENTTPSVTWSFHHEGELDKIGEDIKTTLYRVAQECLLNISKYSNASEVDIILTRSIMSVGKNIHTSEECVQLVVSDNGVGIIGNPLLNKKVFGLLGIRERINGMRGILRIETEEGSGVLIFARIPVKQII